MINGKIQQRKTETVEKETEIIADKIEENKTQNTKEPFWWVKEKKRSRSMIINRLQKIWQLQKLKSSTWLLTVSETEFYLKAKKITWKKKCRYH
ncbi:hypothetical protein [Chryseobacterium indoltheticum]|uniref:hypothetical protein n=1 Tax=Chryseobacterium indoltheticum TaxID=254 RepID=UPI003F4919C8